MKMAKATKATINRLKKMSGESAAAELLYNLTIEAATVAETMAEFPEVKYNLIHNRVIVYGEDGLYIIVAPWEKPILRGLYSEYESLIACTFTHGNNQCVIKDINALSKRMIAN
jgi:hypothetical protein